MPATASIEMNETALITDHAPPMVLISGVCEPRLGVARIEVTGPCDRRTAELRCTADVPAGTLAVWLRSEVRIVQPIRLGDDTLRHVTLLRGMMVDSQTDRASHKDERRWTVHDRWNAQHDQTPRSFYYESDEGLLIAERTRATLRAGQRGNRSATLHSIAGSEVYVLRDGGEVWTLGQALQYIAALAGVSLNLDLLSPDVRNAALPHDVYLGQSVERALAALLRPFALVLERGEEVAGVDAPPRFAARQSSNGRRIDLPFVDRKHLGQLLREKSRRTMPRATRWIARAGGKVIESTFTLVPSWDASLEGQPDSTYSRANNDAFTTYANVYRLWSLNEDGRLNDAPFNQPPFDLTGFFDEPLHVPAQPLRFGRCLTLDEAGQRKSAMVEVSVDGGSNWSTYEGIAEVAVDRAAVYLDDATLPASFFAAAKSGDAAVRITATLQSPLPFDVARWAGNPFHGQAQPKVIDVSDAFVFARVDQTSIHRALIDAADAAAQENDPTAAMTDWLLGRMSQSDNDDPQDSITLELACVLPLLRIGDRVRPTATVSADRPFVEFRDDDDLVLHSFRSDWVSGKTVMTLR